MSKLQIEDPTEYIIPVNMNKLQGRMLRYVKAKQPNREILLIYGHHSSIERYWELAKAFGKYGAVTIPDIPGFGGMENIYKLYDYPSIDNLADYLAAFYKLRYKKRRVTIVAVGYGFTITTRMLQKYPDIIKKLDLFIGIDAFSHRDDIVISRFKRAWYIISARILNFRLSSSIFRTVWLRLILKKVSDDVILSSLKKFSFRGDIFFEPSNVDYKLWLVNDMRTHAQTIKNLLKLDNCQNRVNIPLWHVAFDKRTFFNDIFVEQHLKVIFPEYHKLSSRFNLNLPLGSPKNRIGNIIPPQLRKKLKDSSNFQ